MLTNEKGITLVELLATLMLISVIVGLITTIHLFGQNQYTNQSIDIEHQSEVRLAMMHVTRDIRKGTEVTAADSVITIDGTEYKLVGSNLMKGNQVIARHIRDFCVNDVGCANSQANEINIRVSSQANRQNQAITLESVLYVRE